MERFNYNNITIDLYNDYNEFINEYYDIPENAILDIDDLPTSSGFANISDNIIIIYSAFNCPFDDLLSTVAHELGHLINGGFTKNPPDKQRYDKKHEAKAEHYEKFVIDSYKLTKIIKQKLTIV